MSVAKSCKVRLTSADKSTVAFGAAPSNVANSSIDLTSSFLGAPHMSSRASAGMHARALGDRLRPSSHGGAIESAADSFERSPGAGVVLRDGLKGGLVFNRSIISSFCDSKMNLRGA
jgi:hypothetical protein